MNANTIWRLQAAFIAVTAAIVSAAAAKPPGEAVSPRETPIELFNGKDLSGWSTWLVDTKRQDPRGVYTVADGMLRISGDGLGYLSTRRAYRDYRLLVEFKWGTRNWGDRRGKARDSGIFLHSAGDDGNSFDGGGAYKAAIECQVMQGAVGDLLLIRGKHADGKDVPIRVETRVRGRRDADGWPYWDQGGRPFALRQRGRINWFGKDAAWKDTLNFRGSGDVESRADSWTKVECICDGENLRILVNGTLVNAATKISPSAGPILLQCEGSEVFFRKVELHPLDRSRP